VSGFGFDQCERIADFISNGKRYADLEKVEFMGRKATLLFLRARDLIFSEPEKAIEYFMNALQGHLFVNRRSDLMGGTSNSRSGEYARNTAYQLFDFLVLQNRYFDVFVSRIAEICAFKDVVLDPIESPLIPAIEIMERSRYSNKGEASKLKNRFESVRKTLKGAGWDDGGAKSRVETAITRLLSRLQLVAS
jgi:hypothetical protein